MAQTITAEEVAALASKLQVGPDKRIQAELEIDWVVPESTSVGVYQDLALIAPSVTGEWFLDSPTPDDGTQVYYISNILQTSGPPIGPGTVTDPNKIRDNNDGTYSQFPGAVIKREVPAIYGQRYNFDFGAPVELDKVRNLRGLTGTTIIHNYQPDFVEYYDGAAWQAVAGSWSVATTSGHSWWQFDFTAPITAQLWRVGWRTSQGVGYGGAIPFDNRIYTMQVWGTPFEVTPATIQTSTYRATGLDVSRSRKMAAAQLDASLPNVTGDKGYYSQGSPIFLPHNQCRAYAWHGVRANRVRIFTGLLDLDADLRDPTAATVSVKARSRTSLLLDPHRFVASAPQGAGETGAVRTEANGVFLNKSPEYIAGAVLDMAGWPVADRDLAVSGVTIPEYDLADGGQWLDQIAGLGKLSQIALWDFGEDETGVARFGPNILADTVEPTPAWTFEPGLSAYEYSHQVDDIERCTRIRVSGPMASTVPKWAQEWATTILKHPTGSMFVDAEPGYLYVVDGVTQYLYRIRQSDRSVISKWYLGGSLSYAPLGISKDPTDATAFYVLDADWRFGAGTGAKVHKFTFATKALVSTSNLPNGQWSDMKFDGTHLWLTEFNLDRLYKKTYVAGGTATAVANYSYAGHTAPTGLYLNGTTIGLFFNGGEAFYLVDTSLPGTITGTQSTKGTHIEGGEADTVTDIDLYATASAEDFGNTAGYVWKFQLAENVNIDVVKWATDQALEDALGFQAGLASRVHDLHSGDAAHPWERRDGLVTLETVNSEAQCQAVADGTLVLRKHLRRVLDLGVMGNPAVQLNDPIGYPDPVAATDAVWMLDSYVMHLGAAVFTMRMSLLPWEAP